MILIIDDDSAVRSSLSFMLKRAGYEAQTVPGPREAMEVVRSVAPDLILMDMNFTLSTTGEEGLTLLKQVKIFRPETPVILMTAWGSIQLAVQGMQAGAFDFITKPWNNAALLQRIETALQLSGTPQEPTQEQSDSFDRSHIIGRSQGLMDVLNTIARIAKTNASVLITGESGTGKELIAEAIHINSQRAKHPFVKVNLGGISQSLFESEMFGHKKGAFTDASADRIGRFEMANKGTIFLDGEDTSSCSTEDWRKRRTKLQAVFQDASGTLNPMRSVRSNVEEAMVNLPSLSKRQRRERIGELMELTHMEERLLEIPARQLSGGEQRRLSLVRAMSIRPKYLILDEVLSGLDLISADAVMHVLEQYHREFDCAFLLITHDMDSAYRLSDTILTMQAGQIVRVGIKQ